MAFGVLQSALSVIFSHSVRISSRNFLISAVIPYVYVFSIGLGIMVVSFVTGALDILEERQLVLFGWSVNLKATSKVVLYMLGIISEVVLLSSYTCGAHHVLPRPHRGRNRNDLMGDHPPRAGLVLLRPVAGKHNLRFLRDSGSRPSHYGGRGIDRLVRCSSYRRT
jgi:hypothetical protein